MEICRIKDYSIVKSGKNKDSFYLFYKNEKLITYDRTELKHLFEDLEYFITDGKRMQKNKKTELRKELKFMLNECENA